MIRRPLLFMFLATGCAGAWHGALGQTTGDVPTSLAWDVVSSPRDAALGGADAAPLRGDGWTMAYHPAAMDSTVRGHIHTAYLDYFAGMKAGAITLPLRPQGRRASHVGVRFASFGDLEGLTASGQSTGTFSGGDYALQYGTAWTLDSTWVVGATGWLGLRNLAQVNAGVVGCDVGLVKRSKNGHAAWGILVSNWGVQEDFSGIMPEGRLPLNVQFGWTQGFENAPFQLHVRYAHATTWDLAPEGTYDDTYDPLTGELVPSDVWQWGDQFARHLSGGVSLKLGAQLQGQIGYNHRRQKDMVAAGRPGMNGLSMGVRGTFKNLDYAISRSVIHFAGSSTQLGLVIRWPDWRQNSPASAPLQ
ncbi:MAG: hypothetical protein O2791_04100 [Bacteroidetes bacterium]|jgi:hypothetical protein|nr:hypothetical protein [Bacteroidota bacterium]